jgi:hypothetical protein
MDYQKPANTQPSNYEAPQVVKDGSQQVSNTISSIKKTLTDTFNKFSSQPDASSQYSFSNTIVAKFAFLILVIIVFMFLINLGIMLITYFISPANNPYVIKGMMDGTYGVVVPQDPKNNNSVPILRSNNQHTGIEFTWSVWLYINDLNTDYKKYQHIFNKGDNAYNDSGIANINNAPGLYLGPANNVLHIIMNTVDGKDTKDIIDIKNVPIRKWFNVAIRLENTMLDVYINGTISSRLILENVPKQNYNDVYVCQNGGFSGKLADLRYYNSALNVFDINRIVTAGPNTSTNSLTDDQKSLASGFSYLSTKWFASNL